MKTLDDATRTTKLEPEILDEQDLDADDRGDRPNMGPPGGSRMSIATVEAYERCIAGTGGPSPGPPGPPPRHRQAEGSNRHARHHSRGPSLARGACARRTDPVLGSRLCPVCQEQGEQTACSAACRRKRSRQRTTERQQFRDGEVLVLLEHAERLEARAAELRARARQHLRMLCKGESWTGGPSSPA
jgi:hypothetical protein